MNDGFIPMTSYDALCDFVEAQRVEQGLTQSGLSQKALTSYRRNVKAGQIRRIDTMCYFLRALHYAPALRKDGKVTAYQNPDDIMTVTQLERNRHGLGFAEMSKTCGVSPQTIRSWEFRDREIMPATDKLIKALDAMGIEFGVIAQNDPD